MNKKHPEIELTFKEIEEQNEELNFLLEVRRVISFVTRLIKKDKDNYSQPRKQIDHLDKLLAKSIFYFDQKSKKSSQLVSKLSEQFVEASNYEK